MQLQVSQLLTLLSSWLRVNVYSRAFYSASDVDRVVLSANSISYLNKEVDRVLSSPNSINLNKEDLTSSRIIVFKKGVFMSLNVE